MHRPSMRFTWCPRQDSNLRSRLRRAVLYPLSYEGEGSTDQHEQSLSAGHCPGAASEPTASQACAGLAADPDAGRNAATCDLTHPMPEADVARIFTDKATYLAAYQSRQAERIATGLRVVDGVASVDVAGPGFINVTLDAGSAGGLAKAIVDAGPAYGHNDAFAGRKVNLEFVSANPTGPIHLGGTRWAAVGDALARLLQACGAQVTREYYFNDHGAQIDRFARSLLANAKGEAPPEDGYAGGYIADIADAVVANRPDVLDLPDAAAQEVFRAEGVEAMFTQIKKRPAHLGGGATCHRPTRCARQHVPQRWCRMAAFHGLR